MTDMPAAWIDRALAAQARGLADEAIVCLREATGADPAHAFAHSNLGNLLRARARLDDAVFHQRLATRLAPDRAALWLNLGNALHDAGERAEASGAYRHAVELDRHMPEAWHALGADAQGNGRIVDAEALYRRALVLRPDLANAHSTLGTVLRAQGSVGRALFHHRIAARLDPAFVEAGVKVLTTMLYAGGMSNAAIFAAHRQWAAPHEAAAPAPAPHGNDRDPERRLRLAYISADFNAHPVARNMEPILARHDRARFELVCYADLKRADETTRRLMGTADLWRPITGLSDAEVAARMRADRIDLMVSLAGHTAHHRPLLPILRPAPVQISMHDLATSGLTAMDYWITDRHLHPGGTSEGFTERLVRLPWFYLHGMPDDLPPPGAPPMRARGRPTFGSYNNPAKISDVTLDLWSSVLRALPGARLRLRYLGQLADPELQRRLSARFAARGVERGRLVLDDADLPRYAHLQSYREIDVALDTFPFNGSTTTFEALTMGVPVVTLAGDRFLARVGHAMTRCVGHPELSAATPGEFVATAIDLGRDPDRLAALRGRLRGDVAASPLCDPVGATRRLERAFRAMWRRWCRG
jgi:predicted O-linked N-acetylglucosamine transferase (SPINDLY family)